MDRVDEKAKRIQRDSMEEVCLMFEQIARGTYLSAAAYKYLPRQDRRCVRSSPLATIALVREHDEINNLVICRYLPLCILVRR